LFFEHNFIKSINGAQYTCPNPGCILPVGRVEYVDILLTRSDHLDLLAQPLAQVVRHAHAAGHHNLSEHLPPYFIIQLQNRVEDARLQ